MPGPCHHCAYGHSQAARGWAGTHPPSPETCCQTPRCLGSTCLSGRPVPWSALSQPGIKSATISRGKVRTVAFGGFLRRPCNLRGVMRGRWVERSEPSVSLLRTIEVGLPCPCVAVAGLRRRQLDIPSKDCLNSVGIAQTESLPAIIVVSMFGTSGICSPHGLKPDCILAWSIFVFIPQKSDSRSDFPRTGLSNKSRISPDDGSAAIVASSRGRP